MRGKQIRVSRRMLFTWFMLAGLIFLFAPQSLTNKFQFAFSRLFHLPLSIGKNISLSARAQQPFADAFSRKESQYQNYIANLEEELKQERQKVRELSGLRNRRAFEGAGLVLADVIAASVTGFHNELMINRGQSDGLTKGQFVLADNSVIGVISEVSSRTAQVKLVSDSASRIAVKISEVGRVMKGIGNNSAKIALMKQKLKVGEAVFADTKPGFLDSPMIIGKVVQCKGNNENPMLWDLIVKPACEIEKLNKVAVIVMNPQK